MSVDLRANAIIAFRTTGIGAVSTAANSLNRIQSRQGAILAGGMDKARTSVSRLSSASFQAAAGIGAVVHRTNEFQRKALGARIATIADSMERVGGRILIDHEKIAREGDRIKQQALEVSRAYGVSPAGLMEAAEAAAKMGISLEKADSIMRTSALMNMADPNEGFGQAAEFLGTLSKQFRAPEGTKDFGAWILSTGDKIATVASGTRTSISNIEEGFRQFSGVFATFGANVDQSAALIGAMSQGGLLDVESGTALKSTALRFIRPTIDGLSALSAAGFDRRNYMDLTGADPRKATLQLMQQFGAYLGKGEKFDLLGMLSQAQREGRGADPAVIDRIASYVQKRTGGKENYEDTYLKVLNTITTSGGSVKIFEFIRDLAKASREGRLNDAQLASVIEGRHLSRIKTLFQQWGEVERLMALINGLGGEGLNAARIERAKSSIGKWESALASLDRSLNTIRESDAFGSITDTVERFSGGVASLPPGQAEKLGALAIGIAALAGSPLATAVVGVTALAKAMGYRQERFSRYEQMSDQELQAEVDAMGKNGGASDQFQELRKRRIARGEEQPSWIDRMRGLPGHDYNSPELLGRDGNWFRIPGRTPGSEMPDYKPFERARITPPNLWANGDGFWQPPPEWVGDDAWNRKGKNAPWWSRPAISPPAPVLPQGPAGGMIRDIVPTAGPQTIDVTGRVQSDVTVTGQADVNVKSDVVVRVEGPGTVVDKRSTGGTAKVPLNTGKSMADTKAP